MAWTGSGVFNSWLRDALGPTASFAGKLSSGTDTFKAALFGGSVTPDNTVASALTAYNTGTWLAASEITDVTNWVAAGRPLTSTALSAAGLNYVMFDAADTSGAGNVTLSGVYGDLVYDDTLTTPVADQGLAFHYYGGVQPPVTAGTFTIIWDASGVTRWSHPVA